MDGLEVCRRIRARGRDADPDADGARRGDGSDHRSRTRRRRLSAEAVRAARAAGAAAGDPAPREGRAGRRPAAFRAAGDRSRRARRSARRQALSDDESSVRAAARPRPARGPRAVARRDHGPAEQRAARGVRPLDRRAHLAHSRRDRGRSEEPAPCHHRARRRIRLRQGSRTERAHAPSLPEDLSHHRCKPCARRARRGRGVAARRREHACRAGLRDGGRTGAASCCPPRVRHAAAQQAAIERIAARLRTDVALFDFGARAHCVHGSAVAAARCGDAGGWIYGPQGPAWALRLPDGRWFVVRASPRHRAPVVGLLLVLGGIALASRSAPIRWCAG